MSSQVFITVGIIGGVMVVGGLTYITLSKYLNSEQYRKRTYEKNLHERETLLRSRKNKSYRQNTTRHRIHN